MRAGSFFTRALLAALSVPAIAALAACAASSPAASEPTATAAPPAAMQGAGAAEPTFQRPTATPDAADQPPATVDEALANLQRAEGDLGVAVEGLMARQDRKTPSGMPVPPTGGTAPKQEQMKPNTSPGETELGAGDPCFSACRALASMTRATAHLCGLTGDADPRCDSARSRLQGARERVEGSCACGAPG